MPLEIEFRTSSKTARQYLVFQRVCLLPSEKMDKIHQLSKVKTWFHFFMWESNSIVVSSQQQPKRRNCSFSGRIFRVYGFTTLSPSVTCSETISPRDIQILIAHTHNSQGVQHPGPADHLIHSLGAFISSETTFSILQFPRSLEKRGARLACFNSFFRVPNMRKIYSNTHTIKMHQDTDTKVVPMGTQKEI